MAHYWLKLYVEILDDPKMGQLPDNLWRRTIEIFAVAKECNQDGELPSPEDLAWRLRVDHDELLDELDKLATLGILSWHEDGTLTVTKFAERQGPSPVKQRVADHRAKKRRERMAGNEPVTNSYSDCNDDKPPETEAETVTESESDKDSCADAQAKPPTGKNAIKAQLETHFCERTRIKSPPTKTKRQRTAAGTRWWTPLLRMGEITAWDIEAGRALIDAAVEQMDKDGLTIAAPQSIVSVAESINGRQARAPASKYDDIAKEASEFWKYSNAENQ